MQQVNLDIFLNQTLLELMDCLLYKCIKNHYRLIAVDLSRQKELDADPKEIQQINLLHN